jgi:hypothetical protein
MPDHINLPTEVVDAFELMKVAVMDGVTWFGTPDSVSGVTKDEALDFVSDFITTFESWRSSPPPASPARYDERSDRTKLAEFLHDLRASVQRDTDLRCPCVAAEQCDPECPCHGGDADAPTRPAPELERASDAPSELATGDSGDSR